MFEIENQISQPVKNILVTEPLIALDAMGAVRDHHIGAIIAFSAYATNIFINHSGIAIDFAKMDVTRVRDGQRGF